MDSQGLDGVLFNFDTSDIKDKDKDSLKYDFEMHYKTNSKLPYPHQFFDGKYSPTFIDQQEIQYVKIPYQN